MQPASEQILAETTYPHLAEFLRTGGTLQVGENYPAGSFACIRKGNRTATMAYTYRDFAAVLAAMDTLARDFHRREQPVA